MNYLVAAIAIIWGVGLLVFAGRFLNFTRLLYNNLDPAKDLSKGDLFRPNWFFTRTDAQAIDPTNLTELGRQYQKQAARDERLALAWGIGGFALLAAVIQPSGDTFVAIGFLVAVLAGFYFWTRRIRLGRGTRI